MEPLTLTEAARALGITREAVRKRIKRGTLQAEKVDGRWQVYLPGADTGEDGGRSYQEGPREVLIQNLREQNARLWEQVERKDHIIMALTQKIKALPEPDADREAREGQERRPWWRFWDR